MNELDALRKRLQRLERSNRVRNGALALVGIVAIAGLIVGADGEDNKTPKRIEAQAFVLKDSDGRERGEWFATPHGTLFRTGDSPGPVVMLSTMKKDAEARIVVNSQLFGSGVGSFEATKDGVGVEMTDSKFGAHSKWNLTPDGMSFILGEWSEQTDETKKKIKEARAEFPNGGTKFYDAIKHLPYDVIQRGSWFASRENTSLLLQGDHPVLGLADEKGKVRAVLGNNYAVLLDNTGTKRVGLSVGDGETTLGLFDESGSKRASLGTTMITVTKTGEKRQLAESSLVLFDKDGKLLFQAP